ncbi:lytic murein transglycosylase [Kribbella sp. NPDC050820]|uniref:lytic transglycosylase domain-containing protein n=1 Tax=Kribbella sp. NPDC050820 TaxID=3155408 RepID=UPI0033D30D45
MTVRYDPFIEDEVLAEYVEPEQLEAVPAGPGRVAKPVQMVLAGAPVIKTLGESGIPDVAVRAYKQAEARLAVSDPGCGVPWTLLAAIGRVESNHGRFGGAQLRADGSATRRIRGIPLDGRPNVALIRDTDNGALDGDTTYDRAVGPMQFIPTTWRAVNADANADGFADPNNLFDATQGAAQYLCTNTSNLTNPARAAQAVRRYNNAASYVRVVLALSRMYQSGRITALPSTGDLLPPDPTTPPPVRPWRPIPWPTNQTKPPLWNPTTPTPPTTRPSAPPTSRPSTTRPSAPTTARPTAPATTRPTAPATTRPTAPTTARPTAPTTTRPTTSDPTRPSTPSTTRPSDPDTTRPPEPKPSAPTASDPKPSDPKATEPAPSVPDPSTPESPTDSPSPAPSADRTPAPADSGSSADSPTPAPSDRTSAPSTAPTPAQEPTTAAVGWAPAMRQVVGQVLTRPACPQPPKPQPNKPSNTCPNDPATPSPPQDTKNRKPCTPQNTCKPR